MLRRSKVRNQLFGVTARPSQKIQNSPPINPKMISPTPTLIQPRRMATKPAMIKIESASRKFGIRFVERVGNPSKRTRPMKKPNPLAPLDANVVVLLHREWHSVEL